MRILVRLFPEIKKKKLTIFEQGSC